jgi:hypothetical protein
LLGCPLATLKVRLWRARRLLRSRLGKAGFAPAFVLDVLLGRDRSLSAWVSLASIIRGAFLMQSHLSPGLAAVLVLGALVTTGTWLGLARAQKTAAVAQAEFGAPQAALKIENQKKEEPAPAAAQASTGLDIYLIPERDEEPAPTEAEVERWRMIRRKSARVRYETLKGAFELRTTFVTGQRPPVVSAERVIAASEALVQAELAVAFEEQIEIQSLKSNVERIRRVFLQAKKEIELGRNDVSDLVESQDALIQARARLQERLFKRTSVR